MTGKTRGWAAVMFGDGELAITTARSTGTPPEQFTEPLTAAVEGQAITDRYAATVRTVQQRTDLREFQFAATIGCENVLCQTLRLPTTDPNELRQMLDLQLDNLTPLPAEEVVYAVEPLDTTPSGTRVLVTIARKAFVNERVAALEASGWVAEAVTVDALAVFRSLTGKGTLPADEKRNALILVSPAAVNILIFVSGHIVAVRSVLTGAADDGAIREELSRALVATEVEWPGVEVGRIIFGTWHETLRGPVAALAQGWGTQAEVLANGASPHPVLSVCLDAARADAGPNLLPGEWPERRRQARTRRLVWRGALALGGAYVLVLAVFLGFLGWRKAQLASIQRDIRTMQPAFKDAREMQKTLLGMQKRLDRKATGLEVLREVTELLPENVKLMGFRFKKDLEVRLDAQAQTATLATDFIGQLEKSTMFSQVKLGLMRSDPATGLTKFDVTCTLK